MVVVDIMKTWQFNKVICSYEPEYLIVKYCTGTAWCQAYASNRFAWYQGPMLDIKESTLFDINWLDVKQISMAPIYPFSMYNFMHFKSNYFLFIMKHELFKVS